MNFVCCGFDVREYPCGGYPSADFSEWDRNEKAFNELARIIDSDQNGYSLLSITDRQTLQETSAYILDRTNDCDLVAIEMPLEIVRWNNLKYGFSTPLTDFDLSGFECCGLDVCDIDGLYTCFNHPEIIQFRQGNGLIPMSDVEFALEVAQLANCLDPKHRPFVVMRIYSLRAFAADCGQQ